MQKGECWRLVDERFFQSLPEHSTPEVHRVSLEALALQVLAMGLEPREFANSLLDPPHQRAVDAALTSLREIGAIGQRQRPTTVAVSRLFRTPLDHRVRIR